MPLLNMISFYRERALRGSILLLFLLVILLFFRVMPEVPTQTEAAEVHEQVDVTLVNVYLTATDSKGNFVSDLKLGDIVLKEDGVPQPLNYFAGLASEDSTIPVIVVFLVDNSISMNERFHGLRKMDIVKSAGSMILHELRDQDRMAVISFNQNLAHVSDLTSDKEKLKEIINSTSVETHSTALFDAVDFAIKKIWHETGRKVIIICSDGQDNASRSPLKDILSSSLGCPDLMIVGLGTIYYDAPVRWYREEEERKRGKSNLITLADNTGGYTFFPSNQNELQKAIYTLGELIRNQYSLGYYPANRTWDGSWRRIEILCKRSGVKLRYREGYFAQ